MKQIDAQSRRKVILGQKRQKPRCKQPFREASPGNFGPESNAGNKGLFSNIEKERTNSANATSMMSRDLRLRVLWPQNPINSNAAAGLSSEVDSSCQLHVLARIGQEILVNGSELRNSSETRRFASFISPTFTPYKLVHLRNPPEICFTVQSFLPAACRSFPVLQTT